MKAQSLSLQRVVISSAALALAAATMLSHAQVRSPGSNQPLPDSAQKAPPFQQVGGGFNGLLIGEYILSGSAACVNGKEFNPRTFEVVQGPGFLNTFTVNGVRVFNGDGTGTMKARSMIVGEFNTMAVDFEGSFEYEVGPDLSIEIRHPGIKSTQVAGPQPGRTTFTNTTVVFTGRITEDLGTIHVMQYAPLVEEVVDETGIVLTRRICARDRTLTRLRR